MGGRCLVVCAGCLGLDGWVPGPGVLGERVCLGAPLISGAGGRKSVVWGKSAGFCGGRRIGKKGIADDILLW